MKLDRTYQLELLQLMAESYPRAFDNREVTKAMSDEALAKYVANIVYLEQHGLVDGKITFAWSGEAIPGLPTISHRGIDFLADDGGLSAILGVTTIKIHGDTIKDLIQARIEAAPLPPADKKKLLGQLRQLPADATKHLVMKLLDKGLEAGPATIQWLDTFFRSLS